MNAAGHDVTALLHAWTAGDLAARDRLMAVLYRELHRRAAAQLRRERPGHTLQPTALVHEAYLRLVDQRRVVWQNRGQFFGVACQIFYLAPGFDRLMAASVNGGASAFEVGDVRPLFDTRAAPNQAWMYDISPDGQRFLVNTLAEEATSDPIRLVVNWPALLKK